MAAIPADETQCHMTREGRDEDADPVCSWGHGFNPPQPVLVSVLRRTVADLIFADARPPLSSDRSGNPRTPAPPYGAAIRRGRVGARQGESARRSKVTSAAEHPGGSCQR